MKEKSWEQKYLEVWIETQVSFSEALQAVKVGHPISRQGWNGAGLKVYAQYPDAGSKNTLPYLYIQYPADAKTTPNARVPWLASQTDIMAEDWIVHPTQAYLQHRKEEMDLAEALEAFSSRPDFFIQNCPGCHDPLFGWGKVENLKCPTCGVEFSFSPLVTFPKTSH